MLALSSLGLRPSDVQLETLPLSCHKSGGEGLKALAISFNKSCIMVGGRALQGCHKGDRILGSFEALSFVSQRNRHLESLPSAKRVKCYIKQNLQAQVSSVRSLVSPQEGCYLALFLSPFLLSFFPSCLSSFLPGGFTSLSGSKEEDEINHILEWLVLDLTLNPLPLNWSELQPTSRSF